MDFEAYRAALLLKLRLNSAAVFDLRNISDIFV